VIAALATAVVPSYISGTETTYWLQLIFGAFAILLAFTPDSARGVPVPVQRWVDRHFRRAAEERLDLAAADAALARTRKVEQGALELRDVTVRFGGLVAVDGLSLEVPTGSVTGLIGPNGASKTTTFNAASGLNRPSSGAVLLDGRDVSRTGVAERARRGLGRTFQKMELMDSLTVRENVSVGIEATLAGRNPLTHLVGRPGDKGRTDLAVAEAIELCDLGDAIDAPVAELSTGRRRLVELARCLAGPFRILLLDEPSSGLDRAETDAFGAILRRVVAERGVGILLVEHDMNLVMGVSHHIYVLDFGKLIFTGTPNEVSASPIVQAAYLGYEGSGDAAVSKAAAS
jgi:ABC-type branched-subunit amino acid transport system ATPase component